MPKRPNERYDEYEEYEEPESQQQQQRKRQVIEPVFRNTNEIPGFVEGQPFPDFSEEPQPITEADRNELDSNTEHVDGIPDLPTLFEILPTRATILEASISLQFCLEKLSKYAVVVAQKVKAYGDSLIEETILRRKKQEIKEAQENIKKAEDLLKVVGKETQLINMHSVLRIIELEKLIENVARDAILESTKQVPALLVVPILELLTHYDEYFSWDYEHDSTGKKIQDAYSEFKNKQKIRDEVFKLYSTNVTLNDVIDELIRLYENSFSVSRIGADKSLSIKGRVRIYNDILTKPSTTNIAKNLGIRVSAMSSVDYADILERYVEDKSVVDLDIAELRRTVAADQVNAPITSAIPAGQQTRHMDIAAHSGYARFDVPLAGVLNTTGQDNEDDLMETQNDEISEFEDAGEGDQSTGEYMYPEERLQILSSRHINIFGKPLPENVKAKLAEYAAKREQGAQETKKMGEMAIIATERMNVATNLIQLILDLQKAFKTGVFAVLSKAEKEQAWNNEIHRIFMEWYRQTLGLEQQREALDQLPAPASKEMNVFSFTNFFTGKGGKKSHKNNKKHNKKQTRKNNKHSSRKVRKNHKKRGGNTKKQ
jgi:hypothetical protein